MIWVPASVPKAIAKTINHFLNAGMSPPFLNESRFDALDGYGHIDGQV
ncbi:MAG: hypothetical protein NZM37_08185 [Sandaracinaceae bacterium]|nr:hypothetical protein [Sandaracinaceae bacterium]MDW8245860.1 hypothetical protein [Sandaracinaceae bacterium]